MRNGPLWPDGTPATRLRATAKAHPATRWHTAVKGTSKSARGALYPRVSAWAEEERIY
jgi:hypothetical protein